MCEFLVGKGDEDLRVNESWKRGLGKGEVGVVIFVN